MSDPVVAIISEQRKRLVGSILGHAERELYADLTEGQQRAFRQKVLTSAGAFGDFVIDVVRGVSANHWVNDEAMQLLADISTQVRNLSREE